MEPDPAALRYAVIAPVAAGVTADPAWISELAQHVEACGFESIVVVEHTVVVSRTSSVYPYDVSGRMELADDCPIPDPLELLLQRPLAPPRGRRDNIAAVVPSQPAAPVSIPAHAGQPAVLT